MTSEVVSDWRLIPNALDNKPHWWNVRALNGFDDGITGNFQAYPSWHQALGNPSNSAIGLLNASAYNNWSWRTMYIVQVVPALYLLIAIQFVPETPRWLLSKGREDEALAFLVKYHGDGNPNDELVLFEFEEMKETLRKERELNQTSWGEIFGRPGNRHRIYIVLLIVCCQNLAGTAIIGQYYTNILRLVGITESAQQTGINAGLTGAVIAGAVVGLYLINRLKRRTHLMGSWATLVVVNVAFTVTAARYEQTGSKAAGLSAFAVAYQAECLSFATRAKGMGIWGVANKSISVFNAYVNSIALANIGWKYYLVYTCILTAQLVGMYFLCVETSGLTLEEISYLFDGEQAAPTVSAAPYEAGMHEKKGSVTAEVKEIDIE
ncbi:hypothetical protein Rhopal_003006-T1 [Rhodotorula paludigena]|uniref:Major facilitator superfamily (MFS) profile domain-containing protein n=1 Tax=Rhodotorula paludigena TaxID=86838 RepID=A0AAV5GKI3_9BASI|nr:hypothetical protein Rhopal_003006-T1 [Rhodotorula paludigena]